MATRARSDPAPALVVQPRQSAQAKPIRVSCLCVPKRRFAVSTPPRLTVPPSSGTREPQLYKPHTRKNGPIVNEQTILDLLFARGPCTRSDLARLSGLSKPSISRITQDLSAALIIEEAGSRSSGPGPAAALYQVRSSAGYAIGIDLGRTKIQGAIVDMLGGQIDTKRLETDPRGGLHVVEQMAFLCRQLERAKPSNGGRLDHIAIASPGVVDPRTGRMRLVHNLLGFDRIDIAAELASLFDASIHVDNGVNMAAEAEHHYIAGHSVADFVYLSIGAGIGLAVVMDGAVRRGRYGAAGEIAYLPIGADPFDVANQRRGPLEEAVDGPAILRRFSEQRDSISTSLGQDASVPEIFAAASNRDPLALRVVDDEARLVAMAITAATALLDPELVVLGGGIGSSPALVGPVRSWCARLMTTPPRIEPSGLGSRAPLLGATEVALARAKADLLPRSQGVDSRLLNGE